MDWKHVEGPFSRWNGDGILFYAWQDDNGFPAGFVRWMDAEAPWLKDSPALKDFRGKKAEILLFYGPADARIPRVILVGLGKKKDWSLEVFRHATAMAVRRCRDLSVERVLLPVTALSDMPESEEILLREALMAARLGLYRYDELKTRDVEKSDCPKEVIVCSEGPLPFIPELFGEVDAVSSGIRLARDLATAPRQFGDPHPHGSRSRPPRLRSRHGLRCLRPG